MDRVGLEDAGEIVALATTEQLARVFDEDLWKSERAGEDEKLDPARFLVWLHVMLEAGDTFAAARLVELPEELVLLALHKNVLVLDMDALIPEMIDAGEDADAVEKALSDCLSEEIDQYNVVARRHEGWDDLLTILLALDRDHHAYLSRLLERCAAMSAEHIDDNGGLYDVLTSEQMLEGDVGGDREARRAAEGHVAPSDAKAFLRLAARGDAPSLGEHDAMTRAWLRELSPEPASPRSAAAPDAEPLLRLLDAHGEPAGDATTAAPPPPAELPLAGAMRALSARAPDAFARRSEELAFLANALSAGHEHRGRRLRPVEAVRVALAAVDRGLSMAARRRDPSAVLAEATADGLFRLAWAELHREGAPAVDAFVAQAL